MLRKLSLENVGPAPRMEFTPGERLNVITGDNGLGKSFLLDLAWWAVTRTWAGLPVRPPIDSSQPASIAIEFAAKSKMARLRIDYDRSGQAWRFPKGKPGQPGLVVYGRVDGDFAVWDSNRRFGDPDEADTGIPKGLVFSRENVWNGLRLDDRPICNGLLADWVTWQQTQSWEASSLASALELLSPSDSLPVRAGKPARVELLDSRLIPTVLMPYGQEVPITQASAGMKRVIAFAYLLVWAWREHLEVSRIAGRETAERMLVIIDEVEAHLHPRWQRVILSAIVEALAKLTAERHPEGGSYRPPEIQYIVATHSPLVLASLEPLFDATIDSMFELQLDDAKEGKPIVGLHATEFRRRGGAENWLESDAFGLSSSRSVPAELAIDRASELLQGKHKASPADLSAMRKQLSAVLPDVDPFWTRWRAMTEQVPENP